MYRLLLPFLLLLPLVSGAQISFTNRTDLLPGGNHFSGVAIAVLDMNGDGRDDIVRLQQGVDLSVVYQASPNELFAELPFGVLATNSQWGMCAADVDNNGYADVLVGGRYDGVKILSANALGDAYDLGTLTTPSTFVQCTNFADINNDGWLDAFVCHDDGVARIWGNDGSGNLVYQTSWINLTTVPPSDNSGNYGSVWSDIDNDGDLDLYIAKCRQGVNDPADGRRINQLFLNNGDGTYTQDTDNASGLRIGAQSWTADFGDIDNDGDFDCFVTNHDVSSQLLENDGAGHFTDISVAAGLQDAVQGLPIQGIFRDFDNDGYVDILVAGSDQHLFRNNGDKTFSEITGLFNSNQMESYAVGDLNYDGFQDIYAGYAEIYTTPSNIPDALWLNNGNDNHFFGMNLQGVQSNRSAVGAKIRVFTPLGMQTREVRSGESYGIMNSMQVHVGLGASPQIDSVFIYWPSGTIDSLYAPLADQYLGVQEGGCVTPAISIVAQGSTAICTGDTVTLEAPAGYSYVWSTGDTTATIAASAAGVYKVTVTDPAGCSAVSNGLRIVLDPVEIPSIAVDGDTTFCAGGSVLLTASSAAAYAWSTGDTTQSIAVTQTGAYFVTTQGQCASFTSDSVLVTVLDAPVPAVSGDTVAVGSAAFLAAVGDSLLWYDAPAGGNLLNTAPTFQTPALGTTTTYWVSNFIDYDQPNVFTGMENHQGSNFNGPTFNGQLIFDATAPFRLAGVKVYCNTAGQRKIVLRNSAGDELQSALVTVPPGTSVVNLDFDVQVAQDLVLTTDAAVNQANFNTNSPQLRRSDSGVNYPYEMPGVLSIKGSSGGANFYYYFYQWEIDFPGLSCESPRAPVVAVVDSTLVGAPDRQVPARDLRVFPNPASDRARVEADAVAAGPAELRVCSTRGGMVRRQHLTLAAGAFRHDLDLSALPPGVYWVELHTADGVWLRRLVRM